MTLEVGSRVGAYEVVALIGEGGMGRVYRARDSRLKRDVAIKALHADVAGDADRIARFRREAEALAALNHPHIGGIHDIVECDGAQFLVLEMIEGQTLADRIQAGEIPAEEVLTIAAQIARALEAAHDRGIVHRDLKPANVKVTPDGVVKVLDFGLAKDQSRPDARAASLTHSPTVVSQGTAGGMVLGTASYMSPEQARGQRVDAQSDIFAFGCVLYEMLTRTRAFDGPTATDVLAAIVRSDVDWSRLPPALPPAVHRVLRRCLEKDRARRLHHIGDARLELEDALAAPEGGAVPRPPQRRQAAWPWIVAAASLASALALAVVLALNRRATTPPLEMRVELNTAVAADPWYLAISPDATRVAYMASSDGVSRLWVRSLPDPTPRVLTGTELASAPFWSPDGRALGFFSDGKLKRIDIAPGTAAGGLTRNLGAAPIGAGGSWNRDGVIVYAPSAVGPILRIPAAGGEAVPVTRLLAGQSGHRFPFFLPDQRHFLFYARGTPEVRGIYVGSLDDTTAQRLIDTDTAGVVTASGHLLFARQGTLFGQTFDVERLQLGGEPFAVAEQVAFDIATNAVAATTSRAGPWAYRTGGSGGQRRLQWLDRTGKQLATVGIADTTSLFNPELSPDGHWVAINRTVDAYQDIWLIESARGVLRRFSFDPLSDQIPVWLPDSSRVIFGSNRQTGIYDLYIKDVNGQEPETLLLQTKENKFAMSVSRDGRMLLYRNTGPNTNWDLWAVPLAGDASQRTPFPVVHSSFQELMGEISSDNGWVAYQSNESGRYEIYVQTFPQAGARMQVSTQGGSQPRWSDDGKELFFISLDSRLMVSAIRRDGKGQLNMGEPQVLFPVRTPGGPVPIPQKQQYDVSRDGQRFLINALSDAGSLSPITLVMNWKP
jgi:Tol biopolymer transport system component